VRHLGFGRTHFALFPSTTATVIGFVVGVEEGGFSPKFKDVLSLGDFLAVDTAQGFG